LIHILYVLITLKLLLVSYTL